MHTFIALYCRFKTVSQRQNLKLLIHESTMDIFRKYTDELEEVQNIYEANKVITKVISKVHSYCKNV